jgi:hypothetical protein
MKNLNTQEKPVYKVCCRKGCNEPKHKKQHYCETHSKEFYASYRRGKNIFAIEKDLDVGKDIPRGKFDYYIIYYIPSIHYCGITNSPYDRLYQHKHYNKKVDIKGWCVLQTCNTYLEALAIEAEFHLMGMNGHIEMGRINYKL